MKQQEDIEMTKRELIAKLEALDCADDTDVLIDEDFCADPGNLAVRVQTDQDETLIIIVNFIGKS